MYQALYRKWRPVDFDDVCGQNHITETLKGEIMNNRLSHAYLFTGSRGTGKTSCAKILSRAVNCLHPVNGNPCNGCEICRGIAEGSVMDVVEMDAASNNSVNDIRDLLEEINYTPVSAKYRVYIIDEVHMLSPGAFNAFLKTLEEPPSYVIFILATTEVHKLPATILSRCQRFDFKRIAPEHISERLKYVAEKENASITDEAAMLIAGISDGGMRDALSLLDRCLVKGTEVTEQVVRDAAGLAGSEYLFEFSRCVAENDFASAINLVTKLNAEAADIESLTNELTGHFRNLMICKTVKDCAPLIVCTPSELEQIKARSASLKLSKILSCIDVLTATTALMKGASNKKICLETAVIKMCSLAGAESTAAEEKPAPSFTAPPKKEEEKPVAPVIPVIKRAEEKPEAKEPPKAEAKAEEKPEAKKEAPQSNNQADGDFNRWPEVLELLIKKDIAFSSILKGSTAFFRDGRLLIRSENKALHNFLVTNQDHANNLKDCVYQVLGRKVSMGVAGAKKQEQSKNPLENLLGKVNEFNN